jgi:hypothetical protein
MFVGNRDREQAGQLFARDTYFWFVRFNSAVSADKYPTLANEVRGLFYQRADRYGDLVVLTPGLKVHREPVGLQLPAQFLGDCAVIIGED